MKIIQELFNAFIYVLNCSSMKIAYQFLIFIQIFFLFSCGREKLTPLYSASTVNQLRNEKPINFSYEIDDSQIDEYAKDTGKFPIFGKLFKAIAIVLANSKINGEGGHELELPSIDVDLSSMSKFDFLYIDWINLDSLMVTIRNPKSKDVLTFIDKLEIWAKFDYPIEHLPTDESGYSRLVYFDKLSDPFLCDGKCINLNIEPLNWKKLLQKNKVIHIQPKLVINSVPLSSMKLAGSVNFSVKFNPGF